MMENDAIDRFIKYLESTEKSPATLINYRRDLNAFAKWFEDKNSDAFLPAKITTTNLRQYKSMLIDHPFKPKTINRRIGSLRSFINWLWDIG